jgi:hypothetical protein
MLYAEALCVRGVGTYFFEIIIDIAISLPLVFPWSRLRRQPLLWWLLLLWLFVDAGYLAFIAGSLFLDPTNDGSMVRSGALPGLIALALLSQAAAVWMIRFKVPFVERQCHVLSTKPPVLPHPIKPGNLNPP